MKATDQIHTNVCIRLSRPDRMRVLLLGRLAVRVVIDTEFPPGQVSSAGSVSVPPLRKRKPMGAYTTEEDFRG